jgi:hypothetical protein
MKYKSFFAAAAVSILMFVLSGCVSMGAKFTPEVDVPGDQGLVYVYRAFNVLGSAITYDLHAGDLNIVTVYNGGYFPYACKPGKTEFWAQTEARASIVVDVEPGKTYYLRCSLGLGFFVGHPTLELVTFAEAQDDLAGCQLIERN